MSKENTQGPKILVFDIETSPLICYTWGLFDQNIGLNQIYRDWQVLSWGAKWFDPGNPVVMYDDVRNDKNFSDKRILKNIRDLLDEADVVLTQNGTRFDVKRLNARFAINKIDRPSSYKHIDTLQIAKASFGFTSNKLEYMTDALNSKYKKLKHDTYPGFELWRKCLLGDNKAWKEMERYNKHDVLSLEELYTHLRPYDNTVNFDLYKTGNCPTSCACGSTSIIKNGYFYTSISKYQRYKCTKCGTESRDRKNLGNKSLRVGLR